MQVEEFMSQYMQGVKSYTIWAIFVTLCVRWMYPVTFCHNSIAWHQRAKVKNVDVKVQMWARKWKGVHVTNPAKTVVPSRHSEVRGRLLQSGHSESFCQNLRSQDLPRDRRINDIRPDCQGHALLSSACCIIAALLWVVSRVATLD